MRTRPRTRFVLVSLPLAACIAVVACSDDPAPPPAGTVGGSPGAQAGSGGTVPGAGGTTTAGGAGSSGAGAAGAAGDPAAGAAGVGASGAAGDPGAGAGGVGVAGAAGDPGAGAAGVGGAMLGGAGGQAGATGGQTAGSSGSAGQTAGGASGVGGSAGTGAGGTAGGAAGSGGAAAAKPQGIVEVAQVSRTYFDQPWISSRASAVFRPASPVEPTKTCTTKAEGPCAVERCVSAGNGGAGGGQAQPYLDAGNIETENLSKPVVLSFDNAKTGYAGYDGGSSLLWAGGEMVTIKAKGGKDVGAFSTELKAPKELTIGPVPAGEGFLGSNYAVNTDVPFEVSWNDTANADVEVIITSASEDKTISAVLSCRFDPTTSPRSVPTTLLAELVKTNTGSLLIGAVSRAVVPVGGTDVEVRLVFASASGGAEISGTGKPSP